MEYESGAGKARPASATLVRALYSPQHLYIRFDAKFDELTTFEPPRTTERPGLWDRDVVEAFIAPNSANIRTYYEFEVAPTNEKLDLVLSPETSDFGERLAWNSGFESFSKVDESTKVWTCVMRIPLQALASEMPQPGTKWRANFYRIDRAQRGFLAWNPTLTRTYHTPERFGWLEFAE